MIGILSESCASYYLLSSLFIFLCSCVFVRVSLLCLAAAFKYMLEYDLNADVRRAVLSSIAATARTVAVILERTRDVKDVVRRLAYKVIGEKIHVRALTIAQRVRLLRQGLADRTGSLFITLIFNYSFSVAS